MGWRRRSSRMTCMIIPSSICCFRPGFASYKQSASILHEPIRWADISLKRSLSAVKRGDHISWVEDLLSPLGSKIEVAPSECRGPESATPSWGRFFSFFQPSRFKSEWLSLIRYPVYRVYTSAGPSSLLFAGSLTPYAGAT